MTWGESACLIYRWPCLKALQTPTERPVGERERERGKREDERMRGTGRGGVWRLHIPCSRAKEMHGHALFSKACLGVIHKGAWLVERCCICRDEGKEVQELPECKNIIQSSSIAGLQERSSQSIFCYTSLSCETVEYYGYKLFYTFT